MFEEEYRGNSIDVNDCSSCPFNLGERGGKIWCDHYEDFVSNCACGGSWNTKIIDV